MEPAAKTRIIIKLFCTDCQPMKLLHLLSIPFCIAKPALSELRVALLFATTACSAVHALYFILIHLQGIVVTGDAIANPISYLPLYGAELIYSFTRIL